MGNEGEGEKTEKAKGDPSGDILPCRHCNLLYKLHVSSAARLKTSSSMYQSPVNCWVNFPLTLVLWFITHLQIWHCQSKCSGRTFTWLPGFPLLPCLKCPQFIRMKREICHHALLATCISFISLKISLICYLSNAAMCFKKNLEKLNRIPYSKSHGLI